MTACKRGDVVLVAFPHSDLLTYTKRPALVVQADDVVTGIPQRIVALITTNLSRSGPSRVTILKHSATGRAMGLLHDSVIVADNLATVHERQIQRVIGRCPAMSRVDQSLVLILGLR
jgi:mRNA interferase MazF